MRNLRPLASDLWLLKSALFLACLIPFGQLLYKAYTGDLGVNPIETITHFTGDWTLILLLTTLAVTPLRRITGWNQLIKFRRLLGLFAFFYVMLHFLTYVVLDLFFDFHRVGADIAKRPYITVGFTGFVLLFPLAITSTSGMIRRLGKRWQQLHRVVYLAALAGVIHFYWLVKADVRRPLQYAAVLTVLLGYRAATQWIPAFSRAVSNRNAPPSLSGPAPRPAPQTEEKAQVT